MAQKKLNRNELPDNLKKRSLEIEMERIREQLINPTLEEERRTLLRERLDDLVADHRAIP